MRERKSCQVLVQPPLTVSRLQEVFGGNAVSDEYGIGRHVANLFVTQTYEGQSDIHCESDWNVAATRLTCTSFDPWASNHGTTSILLIVRCEVVSLYYQQNYIEAHPITSSTSAVGAQRCSACRQCLFRSKCISNLASNAASITSDFSYPQRRSPPE